MYDKQLDEWKTTDYLIYLWHLHLFYFFSRAVKYTMQCNQIFSNSNVKYQSQCSKIKTKKRESERNHIASKNPIIFYATLIHEHLYISNAISSAIFNSFANF